MRQLSAGMSDASPDLKRQGRTCQNEHHVYIVFGEAATRDSFSEIG
jgi:hypothetical protein